MLVRGRAAARHRITTQFPDFSENSTCNTIVCMVCAYSLVSSWLFRQLAAAASRKKEKKRAKKFNNFLKKHQKISILDLFKEMNKNPAITILDISTCVSRRS